MRRCNLNFLLEEKPEIYYWIGFILADGHISKNNRLKICLSVKDIEHLNVFAKLANANINTYDGKKYCEIKCRHTEIIKKIKNKFDIKNNKTVNPPKLKIKNKKLLLSLLVGFIDGDGCIDYQTRRKHPKLRIKVHSSWFNFLHQYKKFCSHCKIKINNQGYADLSLTSIPDLVFLKKQTKKLDLPVLNRKWDHIDENYVTFYQRAEKRKKNIFSLYKKGFSYKEISRKLELKYITVYNCIKRAYL